MHPKFHVLLNPSLRAHRPPPPKKLAERGRRTHREALQFRGRRCHEYHGLRQCRHEGEDAATLRRTKGVFSREREGSARPEKFMNPSEKKAQVKAGHARVAEKVARQPALPGLEALFWEATFTANRTCPILKDSECIPASRRRPYGPPKHTVSCTPPAWWSGKESSSSQGFEAMACEAAEECLWGVGDNVRALPVRAASKAIVNGCTQRSTERSTASD